MMSKGGTNREVDETERKVNFSVHEAEGGEGVLARRGRGKSY